METRVNNPSKNEIIKYLDTKSLTYKESGTELFVEKCPFCPGSLEDISNQWKLSINGESGLYNCHRASCQAKGNWYQFKKYFGDTKPFKQNQKKEKNIDDRIQSAKKIWKQQQTLAHPNAEAARKYLKKRGLKKIEHFDSLGYLANHEYWDGKENKGKLDALVAKVVDPAGQFSAIHKIYLSKGGDKADVGDAPVKKSQGIVKGCSVRLDEAVSCLGLAEGVETTLAVREALSDILPMWATLTAGGLKSISIPDSVQEVFIWADLDKKSKAGENAAIELANRLSEEGRKVRIILPPDILEDEKSVDWNDVYKNDPQMIIDAFNNSELYTPQEINSYPYKIKNGSLILLNHTKDGIQETPISNFSAKITVEEIIDDGSGDLNSNFMIEGELSNGKKLPPVKIAASNFSSMNWLPTHWGADPIIFAGQSKKDHVRTAIQIFSMEKEKRRVFSHFGWKKWNNEWIYLHADGAIGENGPILDIYVEPESALKNYVLPDPSVKNIALKAINATLSLLDLSKNKGIGYSLLSGVFRAPLAEINPLDFSMFLTGDTGTFKSEAAALAQGHWGVNFHGKSLPGNWASTANFNERCAFLAKDSLFVIDDFAPPKTQAELKQLNKDADRLFRGQGNNAGRGRMQRDTKLRSANHSRGEILGTGEEISGGLSVRARQWILEIEKGSIDANKLGAIQENCKEFFPYTMSSYVQWLAPQIDELKLVLRSRQTELRCLATQSQMHRRTPETVASLAIGLEMFLTFALEKKAITEEKMKFLWTEGWNSLGEIATEQLKYQTSEDQAERFLDLLNALFVAKKAHLINQDKMKENSPPEDAHNWGWNISGGTSIASGARIGGISEAGGDCIGWINDTEIILQPEHCFSLVQKFASSQQSCITLTQQTLWKRLAEKGYSIRDQGRSKTKRVIGNDRKFKVVLRKDRFLERYDTEASEASFLAVRGANFHQQELQQ